MSFIQKVSTRTQTFTFFGTINDYGFLFCCRSLFMEISVLSMSNKKNCDLFTLEQVDVSKDVTKNAQRDVLKYVPNLVIKLRTLVRCFVRSLLRPLVRRLVRRF